MCLPLMVLISVKILGQSSSLDQSRPSLLPSRCYTLNKDAQCHLTPYSTAVLLPACTEHLECMWLYSPRLLPTLSVHWDLKKQKMGRETSSVNTFVVQVKCPKFHPQNPWKNQPTNLPNNQTESWTQWRVLASPMLGRWLPSQPALSNLQVLGSLTEPCL